MPSPPPLGLNGALPPFQEDSLPRPSGGAAEERLPLAELAAGGAILERLVSCQALSRFQAHCEPGESVRARLAFAWDEAGPVRIDGVLTAQPKVQCHRCLEFLPVRLHSAFSVLAVTDEAEASRLGAQRDVLRIASQAPALTELIEDELLLALPQRPCTDPSCAKSPPLSHPSASPGRSPNPFEALEGLKEQIA